MSMSKKYVTEVLLLTRSYHSDELECWLEWYINILGVDHISLFDNESSIDVQNIINKYKDRVSYRFLSGWPNQHKLYSEYIKESESQWVIPLDDDEILYIGNKYHCSINQLISSLYSTYGKNKYYPLWLCMISKDPIKKKADLWINTHTYYSYSAFYNLRFLWGINNTLGKCFVNTDYIYSYGSPQDIGHNPKCINGENTTLLINGDIIRGDSVIKNNDSFNEDCFIAHYHIKTKEDWVIKCNTPSVRTGIIRNFRALGVYDQIFSYKEDFIENNLIKEKWNHYLFS